MRLVNNSELPDDAITKIADHFGLIQQNLLFFLDSRPNTVRRDKALAHIAENKNRGWAPLPWYIRDSQEDVDKHAMFRHRR